MPALRVATIQRSPARSKGGVGYRSADVVKNETNKTIGERGFRERLDDPVPVILETTMPIASPSYFNPADVSKGMLFDALQRQSLEDGAEVFTRDEWRDQVAALIAANDGRGDERRTERETTAADSAVWEICSWGARRAATIRTSVTGGREGKRFRRMTVSR